MQVTKSSARKKLGKKVVNGEKHKPKEYWLQLMKSSARKPRKKLGKKVVNSEKQKLKESSMDSREIILDFEIVNHYWLDSGEHDLDYGWEIIDTWEYGDHR